MPLAVPFAWPTDLVFALLALGLVAVLLRNRTRNRNRSGDRLASAAAAYVVCLTLVDLPVSSYSGLEPLNLFGIALVTLWLLLVARGEIRKAASAPYLGSSVWLGLFLAWAALSCWRVGGDAWHDWWRLLRLGLTALAIGLLAARPVALRLMASGFVVTMAVLSAVAVTQFAWGRFFWSIGRTKKPDYDYFIEVAPGLVRAPGPFEDPNNMGIFAALALVLMVFRFVQAPHRPGARLEMMVLGPLLLAGMVSSLTRSAAAALGLALVILWPRGRGGGRRARLLLISAVLALGLVALARSVVPVLEGTGPADTLGQRPLYWRTAARIALEHPAFGVGLGGFGAAFAASEHPLPMKMAAAGSHRTHNVFLTLGAETGLVGLTLFVAFLVGPMRTLLRRHDPASRLGMALLAAVLLHASLHNVLLQDLLWLVIGVAIALAAGEIRGHNTHLELE